MERATRRAVLRFGAVGLALLAGCQGTDDGTTTQTTTTGTTAGTTTSTVDREAQRETAIRLVQSLADGERAGAADSPDALEAVLTE